MFCPSLVQDQMQKLAESHLLSAHKCAYSNFSFTPYDKNLDEQTERSLRSLQCISDRENQIVNHGLQRETSQTPIQTQVTQCSLSTLHMHHPDHHFQVMLPLIFLIALLLPTLEPAIQSLISSSSISSSSSSSSLQLFKSTLISHLQKSKPFKFITC